MDIKLIQDGMKRGKVERLKGEPEYFRFMFLQCIATFGRVNLAQCV